jgi:hypothetical protein
VALPQAAIPRAATRQLVDLGVPLASTPGPLLTFLDATVLPYLLGRALVLPLFGRCSPGAASRRPTPTTSSSPTPPPRSA